MSRLRILLALLFAVCLLAPAGAQQFRQPPPYRILVVNDDGVRAPGIAAVAQALQAIGATAWFPARADRRWPWTPSERWSTCWPAA